MRPGESAASSRICCRHGECGGSIPRAPRIARTASSPSGSQAFTNTLRRSSGKTVMRLRHSAETPPIRQDMHRTIEDRKALDDLFSATYEELRRLASSVRRGDPSSTLTPTALVNEAWIKLARSPRFAETSRLHFKRI